MSLRLITSDCPLWRAGERELPFPLPYWAFAWPGGWGISRYLLENPEVVAGKTVVDFASGSGLQSIAAMLAGAAHVEATDIDPYAVAATVLNCRDNGFAGRVRAHSENIIGKDVDADVLLAGDVCYEEPLATEVFAWLEKLAGNGTTVLLGDPGRWALPRMDGSGVSCGPDPDVDATVLAEVAGYELPKTLQDDNIGFQRTHVWRVLSACAGAT